MASKRIRRERSLNVMEAARREFGEGNLYGVRAFGVDRKVKGGRATKTRALNVYVVHKHRAPEHPVPRLAIESAALAVEPDVIGVGVHPWAHDTAGVAPPMLGLYPGAAIHAQGRVPEFGGVACLLGTGRGPSHLLTAGHLFPTGQAGVSVLGALPGGAPKTVGTLQTNLLDATFPVDVALIALTPAGVAIAAQSTGGPHITDIVSDDALEGIEVTAFLSTANDFSPQTKTKDGPVDVQMQSRARGLYFVRQVIGTRAVITNPGDSGTILFNGPASSASAVGICVGQFGPMSVFEPFGRALTLLQQNAGISLQPV